MRNGQTSAGDHIKTLFDCDLPTDKENETFVKCLEKAQLQGPGIRFVVIGLLKYYDVRFFLFNIELIM